MSRTVITTQSFTDAEAAFAHAKAIYDSGIAHLRQSLKEFVGGRDDFGGRVILLNIWATWCPPCREEMPTLDRLQSRLGGADFARRFRHDCERSSSMASP